MKESLYFLAIIPPSPIYEEVMEFKNEVLEKFDSKAALRSPPHITLHMPFKWKDKKENFLIEKLSSFEFTDYPFDIQLKDFDFFPPKVVFVNVAKNNLLVQVQKQLVKHVRNQLNILNADYKDMPFHPHMTIAFRDLKKTLFSEAYEYFSEKKYQASFEVVGFHLMKHDGKRWNKFQFFENSNLSLN